MSNAVRTRLMKGFAAQGFAQIINLIIQIGSVPLYIHFWGVALYGQWLQISTIPAFFALSDLGFANAAGNEMTMRMGRGDKEGALKVFQSAWVLVTGVSLVIVGAMLAAVHWLPLAGWLHHSSLTHQVLVTVVSILVFQVFFDLQTGLIANGYRCDGHFALGTMVRNLQRLTEFVVAAIALLCGAHLIVLALSVTLTRLTGNVLSMLNVRRLSPWLTYGWKHADLPTLKLIALPAISFMGFPIGYAMSLQGMVNVIGAILGPLAVVSFSTSRTLTRFVWQILNAITNTIWVELSTAFGANDLALARKLHRRACQAAMWLAVSASFLLYFAGPLIYRHWAHKVAFDPTLFCLLLVVVICNSLWSTSYAVQVAVNRHQQLAVVFVAATGLSLALASVMTRLHGPFGGLHGAALSLLVIDIFMSMYVVRRSLALVEDTLPEFVKFILTPPAWKNLIKPGRRGPRRPAAEAA